MSNELAFCWLPAGATPSINLRSPLLVCASWYKKAIKFFPFISLALTDLSHCFSTVSLSLLRIISQYFIGGHVSLSSNNQSSMFSFLTLTHCYAVLLLILYLSLSLSLSLSFTLFITYFVRFNVYFRDTRIVHLAQSSAGAWSSLVKKELKACFGTIVKQIWLSSFMHCLYCFIISQTQLLTISIILYFYKSKSLPLGPIRAFISFN